MIGAVSIQQLVMADTGRTCMHGKEALRIPSFVGGEAGQLPLVNKQEQGSVNCPTLY
jgi:hypothetical protein